MNEYWVLLLFVVPVIGYIWGYCEVLYSLVSSPGDEIKRLNAKYNIKVISIEPKSNGFFVYDNDRFVFRVETLTELFSSVTTDMIVKIRKN